MKLKKTAATVMSVVMAISSGGGVLSAYAAEEHSGSTTVTATVGSGYSIVVPQSITLTNASGGTGTGTYKNTFDVTVKGDIGETQTVVVTATAPTMSCIGAADVAGSFEDGYKTEWTRAEAAGAGTAAPYTVKAENLTPGAWTGVATFNCVLDTAGPFIPAGGTYTSAATSMTYTEGDEFPDVGEGDTYTYGDYVYTYSDAQFYTGEEDVAGWEVMPLSRTKTTYGELLEEINGNLLISMDGTFSNCENMLIAPTIPDSVMSMTYTFYGCKKVKTIPNIPYSLQSLNWTFAECYSLTGEIQSNVPDGNSFGSYGDFSGDFYNPIVLKGNWDSISPGANGFYNIAISPVGNAHFVSMDKGNWGYSNTGMSNIQYFYYRDDRIEQRTWDSYISSAPGNINIDAETKIIDGVVCSTYYDENGTSTWHKVLNANGEVVLGTDLMVDDMRYSATGDIVNE